MEYKTEMRCLQFWLLTISMGTTLSFYLIADYYMDPGVSNAFGGICHKRVEDACAYVNSHINPLYVWDYDDNVDCILTLDAGNMASAKYKIEWHHFNLQPSVSCTADYLSLYDADMNSISNVSTLIGTFCGGQVDITGYPTQRYLTLKFHTDGSAADNGWRLRATRYESPPCQTDEFLCASENICIDGRLQCDGTYQCADLTDENDCSFFEELLGAFIALGMGGLVGVGISCIGGCVALWVIVGAFTCCKKCCKSCCLTCCCWWPCCKGRRGNRPRGAKVGPNSDEEIEVCEEINMNNPAVADDIDVITEAKVVDGNNDDDIVMEPVRVDGRNASAAGVGNMNDENELIVRQLPSDSGTLHQTDKE